MATQYVALCRNICRDYDSKGLFDHLQPEQFIRLCVIPIIHY